VVHVFNVQLDLELVLHLHQEHKANVHQVILLPHQVQPHVQNVQLELQYVQVHH